MGQEKIYCWASGLLEIGPHCPEGALPLVSGEKKALQSALSLLATQSSDGVNWLVPKNSAWIDALLADDEEAEEKAAYDSMMNFRAYLERHLSLEYDGEENGVCFFCHDTFPRGLVLPVSITPKFGATEGKSMLVDACPLCAESIAQNVNAEGAEGGEHD